MPSSKLPEKSGGKIDRIIEGVVIAVVAGLILIPLSRAIFGNAAGNTTAVSNPSPIPPTTLLPSRDPGAVVTSGEPETVSTEPVVIPSTHTAQTMFVTSRRQISRNHDVDADETASMDGAQYIHSIVHQCKSFCTEGTGIVEYDLNKEFSTFTAGVGVSQYTQDTSQVGTFVVYVDDEPKGSWQVGYGQPMSISVDVSGGVRLKLESAREGTVDNPVQAGANSAWGVSNGLPDLVWGSPQLHR